MRARAPSRSASPNPSSTPPPPKLSAAKKSKSKTRKRQQQKQSLLPTKLTDNESIECVASGIGGGGTAIRTPLVSPVDRDILVDRLGKEIVNMFGFMSGNKSSSSRDGVSRTYPLGGKIVAAPTNKPERKRKRQEAETPAEGSGDGDDEEVPMRDIVRQRMIVGTNQCTRVLEAAVGGTGPAPSLVLLSRDLRPPTVLAHIPMLCRLVGSPSLVLPGQSSSDLGRALGVKTVAVLLFLPRVLPQHSSEDVASNEGESRKDVRDCHRCIDSFIEFARTKIP